MLNRILLCLLAAIALLTGCHAHPEPEPQPKPVRRTLIIYMAARNDMGQVGKDIDDINEMQRASIPADCRLLLFRATPYSPNDAPQLCELLPSGELRTLHSFAPGLSAVNPQALTQALSQTALLAPAAEYSLILWSHSTGWTYNEPSSTPRRRGFGRDNHAELSIPLLAQAIADAHVPLEYILFDSCYMGCVEVAYELRALAQYFVASVCEVPYDGLPYHLALPGLFNPDTPEGLRQAIDANHQHYAADKYNRCPYTLSLVHLPQMDSLASAARRLLLSGHEPAEDYAPQRLSLQAEFRDSFVDFRHDLAARASSSATLQALDSALAQAVVYERHSPNIWTDALPLAHCCGLSVNPTPYAPSPAYSALQWHKHVIQNE